MNNNELKDLINQAHANNYRVYLVNGGATGNRSALFDEGYNAGLYGWNWRAYSIVKGGRPAIIVEYFRLPQSIAKLCDVRACYIDLGKYGTARRTR